MLIQHPSAPVQFHQRPAYCIGRCNPCDPRCTEPQTEARLKAAKAAQLREWGLVITDRLWECDYDGIAQYAQHFNLTDLRAYVALTMRIVKAWQKETQP